MMEFILHLIGICPDHLSHFDLTDLINLYFNFKQTK
jgi:hypothetical protein